MKLQQFDALPDGFVGAAPQDMQALLGGPALIHLPGERPEPLFVSTLLHGNETTGLHALQSLLHDHAGALLPRALSLFVGNVTAATQGLRALPGQADYNRIWPDAAGHSPQGVADDVAQLAQEVVSIMRQRQVFAALDLHNTSGRNPPHACVNAMRPDCLSLAAAFAQRVLHFTRPQGVLCMAFQPFCPAVTVECGPVGTEEGLQLTRNYLDYCLHLEAAEEGAAEPEHMQLYRSVARVEVADVGVIGVDDAQADLNLVAGIDGYNWRDLPSGTVLGQTRGDLQRIFSVTDPQGMNVVNRYLMKCGGDIVTARSLTPAMLTTDPAIIRQDCLCYFLERVC